MNSRRRSRFHPGPRPNLGLDHSSPGETAPADELAITNSDRSTAAFGARIQKDSRASTPRTVGVIPPDTHTSSLQVARAEQADDGHGETPRTRRPANARSHQNCSQTARQTSIEVGKQSTGSRPHSATPQPVRELPRSSWIAATARDHWPTLPRHYTRYLQPMRQKL